MLRKFQPNFYHYVNKIVTKAKKKKKKKNLLKKNRYLSIFDPSFPVPYRKP